MSSPFLHLFLCPLLSSVLFFTLLISSHVPSFSICFYVLCNLSSFHVPHAPVSAFLLASLFLFTFRVYLLSSLLWFLSSCVFSEVSSCHLSLFPSSLLSVLLFFISLFSVSSLSFTYFSSFLCGACYYHSSLLCFPHYCVLLSPLSVVCSWFVFFSFVLLFVVFINPFLFVRFLFTPLGIYFLFPVSSCVSSSLPSPLDIPTSLWRSLSNLLALYWSYQLSGVFCRPYLLLGVCVCVSVCVCLPVCVDVCARRVLLLCRKKRRCSLWKPSAHLLLLLHLCSTFSSPTSILLYFHSSQHALLLRVGAGAAQEQRSNLDPPPQLPAPPPAQTASALYPISSRFRLSDSEQALPLVSLLVYQGATVVY